MGGPADGLDFRLGRRAASLLLVIPGGERVAAVRGDLNVLPRGQCGGVYLLHVRAVHDQATVHAPLPLPVHEGPHHEVEAELVLGVEEGLCGVSPALAMGQEVQPTFQFIATLGPDEGSQSAGSLNLLGGLHPVHQSEQWAAFGTDEVAVVIAVRLDPLLAVGALVERVVRAGTFLGIVRGRDIEVPAFAAPPLLALTFVVERRGDRGRPGSDQSPSRWRRCTCHPGTSSRRWCRECGTESCGSSRALRPHQAHVGSASRPDSATQSHSPTRGGARGGARCRCKRRPRPGSRRCVP